MAQKIIWIFLLGGLGCVLRFALSEYFIKDATFSFGTVIANITGTLILGLVLILASKLTIGSIGRDIIVIGFCGGLTTFSTFSFQVANHLIGGNYKYALIELVANILICVVVAAISLNYIKSNIELA